MLHRLCAGCLLVATCSVAAEAKPAKVDAVQLEEEALARIQAAVAERYAAAKAGPEVSLRFGFQGFGYWRTRVGQG